MSFQCVKLISCLWLCVSTASALDLKFKPSFLELHADGMVQRVMPGELVEVPLGDNASLEIELSTTPPRKIEISSKGECEFIIFGAQSRLGDGGKMVASMSPETKKLDISWTKGEMTTPPSNFDKSAVVTFFTKDEPEFLRPLEFAGVRPFGYTDILEGNRPPEDGELPYFPPPPSNFPPIPQKMDGPLQQGPPSGQGWVSYEEDQMAPPPLTLPPLIPPRSSPPSQLVFLEPSEAKETEETEKTKEQDPNESRQQTPTPETKESLQNDSLDSTSPSATPPSIENEDKSSPTIPPGKRRAKPTIYQMVMDQEKKQREFLEKIEEVAQQVRTIKEGGSGNQDTPLPRAPTTLTFLGNEAPSLFAPLSIVTANYLPEDSLSGKASGLILEGNQRETMVTFGGESQSRGDDQEALEDSSSTEFEVEVISEE